MNDQIQSRSRLERIILDLDLYKDVRASGTMEDAVQRMRADIEPYFEPSGQSFRLSYVSHDPAIAQKVTARLASLYIEENLRDRASLAENTNLFIESQLEEARAKLLAQEKRLEEYRRRNAGELPSQLESNLQAIQNAQIRLQSLNESSNRFRDRRMQIERQIADAQMLPSGSPPAVAATDGNVPGTAAQQLEGARKTLEAYRLRYLPDHPDVRNLERTIRELEVRAKEEASRPVIIEEKPVIVTPADLARQKRLRDLTEDLEMIDRQLAQNDAEELRLKEQIVDYQRRVEAVPTRESELVELTRDYSILQATYAELASKRENSKLAANLERREIGEQFRILDPASLPEAPYNQMRRMQLMGSGAVAGLVLGLLLVGLLEYRDSTFKYEPDVFRALNLPVLALVPRMASDRERRAQRRRRLAIDVGAVAVLIGCATVLVVWRLQL